MFPFFPPGSNPIPPNGAGGVAGGAPDPKPPPPSLGSGFQPFHMNRAPQFNMANAADMAMAMAMFNQNPHATLQLGLNALAAMQFVNQGANMRPNMGFQMRQNLNMLASIQSANNMMQQGLSLVAAANNPMLQQIASGVGGSQGSQGVVTQPGFSGAAVLQGANMQNNVSQSTSSATNVTHGNVADKSFKSNQHSITQTRFRDNNSRQNVGQFSGSRGRGRGAPSSQTRGRGQSDWREALPEGKSPGPAENSRKRRPTITYDENEIKLWREARKRNFPTTSNVEKKLVAKRNRSESENDDTELRRQQMKEVLAKQQELGFEAAEVPDHFLVGSKNHNYGSRDRTQNRFNNKRGRHEGRGRFHDQRNLSTHPDNTRCAHHVKPREPTLLKKLLSAEIKADKCRILQAFRFMTTNSFFNKWPDKELVFPPVMVKEAGVDSEEMRELEGKSGLDERVQSEHSESNSEIGEEKGSGSAISMRKMEKNNGEADKPEEGEITD